jgi:hypothetical protein
MTLKEKVLKEGAVIQNNVKFWQMARIVGIFRFLDLDEGEYCNANYIWSAPYALEGYPPTIMADRDAPENKEIILASDLYKELFEPVFPSKEEIYDFASNFGEISTHRGYCKEGALWMLDKWKQSLKKEQL